MKYETVLNMTTAKALGLGVPTSILLSAAAGDKFKMWKIVKEPRHGQLYEINRPAEFPRIRRGPFVADAAPIGFVFRTH